MDCESKFVLTDRPDMQVMGYINTWDFLKFPFDLINVNVFRSGFEYGWDAVAECLDGCDERD